VGKPTLNEARAQRRDFGLRLRRLREAAGISQEELANRAGLHRTYVGSVERGERNISLTNIHALADALGVPVGQMFAGRDDLAKTPPPEDGGF
jgi:transcriptional regulator with XRE-family HTH domain